jgi:hypothetical protein
VGIRSRGKIGTKIREKEGNEEKGRGLRVRLRRGREEEGKQAREDEVKVRMRVKRAP